MADTEYAALRKNGFGGWGGSNFDRRFAGWIETFDWLQASNLIPQPPKRLLEIGCGNGVVALEAARRGYSVDGIDLSREAIAWARECGASDGLDVSFHHGNVCTMPFLASGLFDVVIDGNCLHCIMGDERKNCLDEVHRVLRPDGIFVVSTMCGEPKSDDACARFDSESRVLFADGRPYRVLKPADEIESELARAGFRVANKRIQINPWWDHLTLVAVQSPSIA
jgi:2-polyprenyl-3-methyl-5-hydroxy-6-metoxy-1,4-benzoquinol methylase